MTFPIEAQDGRGKDIKTGNYVPDSVYKAVITGTSLFPQMIFAQPALAGFEAIRLVRAGNITWSQLTDSRFSERQVQQTREAIARTHNAYGIPVKEPDYFSEQVLAPVWNHTRDQIHRGASLFTRWAISHGGRVAIDKMLTQKRYAKKADALESLWGAVANVIQGQECLEVGKAIRESFRDSFRSKDNLDLKIDDASLKWMLLEDDLERMVSVGVNKELPAIEKGLGRNIPSNILQGFLDSFPVFIYD